jgi:hypothetical protein
MLNLQATNFTSNKEKLPHAFDPQKKRLAAQLNRMPSTIKRSMRTYETLKTIMNVIERRTHLSRRANRSWNIPMNYLNGNSKKMGPGCVLTKKEDPTMIAWILTMQECGLSITLQQLKKGYTILRWNTK